MICDEIYIPVTETRSKKMTFNKYMTQFRKEESKCGDMVRFMLNNFDFPIRSKGNFDGLDYFIEKNLKRF